MPKGMIHPALREIIIKRKKGRFMPLYYLSFASITTFCVRCFCRGADRRLLSGPKSGQFLRAYHIAMRVAKNYLFNQIMRDAFLRRLGICTHSPAF